MQANEAAAAVPIQEVRAHRDARDDRLFGWLLKGCALLVLASLLGAAGATLWGGRDAFAHFGLGFLTSSEWNPSDDVYGALVPVFGTLVTVQRGRVEVRDKVKRKTVFVRTGHTYLARAR